MAGQIVHDDHITRPKIVNEDLFYEGLEDIPIDGSVHDGGTAHSLDSQGRNQGGGFPVTVRRFVDQALTPWCPTAKAGHIRLGPGLIDEDQALGLDFRLDSLPDRTTPGDVRTILLGCMDRLFLKESPSRLSARPTADSQQSAPRMACNSRVVASGRCATSSARRIRSILMTVAPPRGRGDVSPDSRSRCFTRRAHDGLA